MSHTGGYAADVLSSGSLKKESEFKSSCDVPRLSHSQKGRVLRPLFSKIEAQISAEGDCFDSYESPTVDFVATGTRMNHNVIESESFG